jgi:chemotaxis protein methyltransferase CheR
MSDEERALERLKTKISVERGFNTFFYKDKCIRRRFEVRMRARGYESFAEYASLLDSDPTEYDRLIDSLTINVTKFFRNAETWEMIGRDVVPRLFLPGDRPVKLWSAGCASGEETYSLSILVREWAAAANRPEALERVRFLGTDIDQPSLVAARRAEYPALSLEETSEERRRRWFSNGPPFKLVPEAKQGVIFGRADLLSDPGPRNQSLIMCRNVIIYFDRDVQEGLFEMFYDCLAPGGFLILGRVETLLGPMRGQFRTVSTRERVYQKP